MLEQQVTERQMFNRHIEESDRYLDYLGRRIHDQVLQELVAIHWHLMVVESQLVEHGVDTKPVMEVDAVASRLIEQSNLILQALNTEYQKSTGIALLLERELEKWQEAGGFTGRLVGVPKTELHPYRKLLVYRIAQEAIANIVRHAMASEAEIALEAQDDKFIMRIRDNGIGFNSDKIYSSKTHGLHDMQFRAKCLNGELHIDSAPNIGTTLTLKIPLGFGS